MKKFVLISSLMAVGAVASYGATACASSAYAVSVVTTTGFSCEIGDKIFSNISLTGAGVPTTGTVAFAGGGNNYSLDFANYSAPITVGFTFSFTVAVDTALPGFQNNIITQIQDQMQTSTLTGVIQLPNSTTAQVTHTPGGVINLAGSNGAPPNQTGLATINNVNDSVSFVFTPGADGKLLDASFGISQSSVPEPVTMSLTGLGLLGLGIFGRRRLKS